MAITRSQTCKTQPRSSPRRAAAVKTYGVGVKKRVCAKKPKKPVRSKKPVITSTASRKITIATDPASVQDTIWTDLRRREPEFIGITDARVSEAGKIREKTFYGVSALKFLGKNCMSRNTFDWILDRVIEISGAGDVDENNVRHFTLRTSLALLLQFAAGKLTSSFTYLEEYSVTADDDPQTLEFPSDMPHEQQERIKSMVAIDQMRRILTAACPIYFSTRHLQLSETLGLRDEYLVKVFPRYKSDKSCMPPHEWHTALSLVYQMMIDHSKMDWCAAGPLRVNKREVESAGLSQRQKLRVAMRMLGEDLRDHCADLEEHMDDTSMVDAITEDEIEVSDASELLSIDEHPELPIDDDPEPPVDNDPELLSVNNESIEDTKVASLPEVNERPSTEVCVVSWHTEKTKCILATYGEHRIARRFDNNMINGTTLLKAIGIGTVRRKRLLLKEPTRDVKVKGAAMVLRGVWIPYERALWFAEQKNLVAELYPLFEKDIELILEPGTNKENRAELPKPEPPADPPIELPVEPPAPLPTARPAGANQSTSRSPVYLRSTILRPGFAFDLDMAIRDDLKNLANAKLSSPPVGQPSGHRQQAHHHTQLQRDFQFGARLPPQVMAMPVPLTPGPLYGASIPRPSLPKPVQNWPNNIDRRLYEEYFANPPLRRAASHGPT